LAGLILFNKPFRVLSQFSDTEGRATLADYLDAPGFRPAGRLDYDSEGLLLLTDDGGLQQRISHPGSKTWKTYWVQVEGEPGTDELAMLRQGLQLRDGPTQPAKVRRIAPPAQLWPRQPPVRWRAQEATSWLCLSISEGRNRQVRRMTAAVGHPTLRLIRYAVGRWNLDGLAPGEFRRETIHMPSRQRGRQR
jgi:23S rRNA pseudouridine2457 synthase